MDITDSDNLTKRRTKRILKKKGTAKGQAKIFKVQKRKAKRKAVAKKVVGATVGNALLAPLLPFKKSMSTALNKKGVKVDMEKMEVLAKISMIVEILKDNNLIAFPELDLYYQEGLNILLSKIEKQIAVANLAPRSKIIIARNNTDINRLKQKTGVN